MNKFKVTIISLLLFATGNVALAQPNTAACNKKIEKAVQGCVVGAVFGAILGRKSNSNNKRNKVLLGCAGGAAAGFYIGAQGELRCLGDMESAQRQVIDANKMTIAQLQAEKNTLNRKVANLNNQINIIRAKHIAQSEKTKQLNLTKRKIVSQLNQSRRLLISLNQRIQREKNQYANQSRKAPKTVNHAQWKRKIANLQDIKNHLGNSVRRLTAMQNSI